MMTVAMDKGSPRSDYTLDVKQFAAVRVSQAAGKYAEHAPMATACCMACRACATTNLLALAALPVMGIASAGRRFAKRFGKPSWGPANSCATRDRAY